MRDAVLGTCSLLKYILEYMYLYYAVLVYIFDIDLIVDMS